MGPVAPKIFAARPFVLLRCVRSAEARVSGDCLSGKTRSFFQLTAEQTALLATRGVKRAEINDGLNYISSLTGKTDRRADQEIGFGRVDWSPAARQEIGLQYNGVRWDSPAGLTDAPVVARGRASLGECGRKPGCTAAALDDDAEPALGEPGAAAGGAGCAVRDAADEPAAGGRRSGREGWAPEVDIGPDGLIFGTPAGLVKEAYPDERRIDAGDTVSVQHGHQLLELGMQFSEVHGPCGDAGEWGGGRFVTTARGRRRMRVGWSIFLTDYTYNVHAYPNGGCPSINAATHLFCFTSYSQSFGEERVAFLDRGVGGVRGGYVAAKEWADDPCWAAV